MGITLAAFVYWILDKVELYRFSDVGWQTHKVKVSMTKLGVSTLSFDAEIGHEPRESAPQCAEL